MVLSRPGVASLAVLAGALVFGVVFGLVLAFGSSESPSFEERWTELGVPEAEFVFGGDFTPTEEESARLELKIAQVVYAEHFGVVTSDLTVYVVSNDLFEDYEEQVVSVLGAGHGFESTCGIVPPDEPAIVVPKDCPETRSQGAFLAHEYFRVLQREEGGLAWRRQVGTVRQMAWLDWIEAGSAVYATALVSDARPNPRLMCGVTVCGRPGRRRSNHFRGARRTSPTPSRSPSSPTTWDSWLRSGSWSGRGRKQFSTSSASAGIARRLRQPLA